MNRLNCVRWPIADRKKASMTKSTWVGLQLACGFLASKTYTSDPFDERVESDRIWKNLENWVRSVNFITYSKIGESPRQFRWRWGNLQELEPIAMENKLIYLTQIYSLPWSDEYYPIPVSEDQAFQKWSFRKQRTHRRVQ